MIASVIALIDAGVSTAEIALHTGASAHEIDMLRARLSAAVAPSPAGLTLRQQLLVAALPELLGYPSDKAEQGCRRILAYVDQMIELELQTAPR